MRHSFRQNWPKNKGIRLLVQRRCNLHKQISLGGLPWSSARSNAHVAVVVVLLGKLEGLLGVGLGLRAIPSRRRRQGRWVGG